MSRKLLSYYIGRAHRSHQVIFDLSKADYISSAGLRVLLVAHREMESKGGLILRNLPPRRARSGIPACRGFRPPLALAQNFMPLRFLAVFEPGADGGVDRQREDADMPGRAHRIENRPVADQFAGLQNQAADEHGKMGQKDKTVQNRAPRFSEIRHKGDEQVGAEAHGVCDRAERRGDRRLGGAPDIECMRNKAQQRGKSAEDKHDPVSAHGGFPVSANRVIQRHQHGRQAGGGRPLLPARPVEHDIRAVSDADQGQQALDHHEGSMDSFFHWEPRR